jgi:Zn-finger nucleic acid-binding protein
MCHVRLADAEPAFAPRPPKKPGFWKTVGKTVTAATEALIALDRSRHWEGAIRYHNEQSDADARKQAFFAVTMAQAETGNLRGDKPVPKGAEIPTPATHPDPGSWSCPRSGAALESRTVAGIHMHVNPSTGGLILEMTSQQYLWTHPELWAEVTQAADQAQAEATEIVDGRAAVYLNCPACSGPMSRSNFAKVSGVMVDGCARHGTWFDAGELQDILRFIGDGGHAKSEQFQAKEAEHLRGQRQRIRQIERDTLTAGMGSHGRFFRID